jgi:Na+-driven multidrug efflux pump
MAVMCSSYIFTVGGMIFFQAVSGTGSTNTAFRLELAALVVYTIYCTVIVGIMKADVAVCWTAEHVYGGVLFICSWWYMRSGRWKNRRI